jgi:hypothetical protein
MDEGKQVTARTTGVWCDNTQHSIDGYSCIDRVSASCDDLDASLRREIMR